MPTSEHPPDSYHVLVMGREVLEWLVTDPEGDYADLTVGGGGHAALIFEQLSGRGRLCGADRDPAALAAARSRLPSRIDLWNIRFSQAFGKLSAWSPGGLSGILLDLGVSSRQLDHPARGFSYRFDGPLDMRMNPQQGESAAQLLARVSERELVALLRRWGEEPQAPRVARAILRARSLAALTTTGQLAEVIRQSVPATAHKTLPRVFQALRMEVNGEIAELDEGLPAAWQSLRPGGRLVTLTYHSLEDRPVKQFIQSKLRPRERDARSLFSDPEPEARLPVRGPLTPTAEELAQNPRARSAKLRVVEKLR